MGLLQWADEHKPDLSSLRSVVCGGAAVPESLMRAFEERHGVKIMQAWGMTETSPLGAVARPPADAEGEEHWRYRTATGRIVPLVDARLMGDDGEVPWDGESTGEVEVRGPWIARRLLRGPVAAPTSSTTAGCAPATSPRSTRRDSCGSPTAPRT